MRVGVATVIVTGLMVTAGLTAGMVSANRRERLADASAACERSARTWSAGSAAWGRDRDRIMGSVDLDALRATDPDMAGTLERLSADPVTPAGCTVPYLYRRLGQLTEQAAGLLDDGSASPADMDRLSQGIGAMVASLASGTR